MATGRDMVLALRSDERIFATGSNAVGALGVGTLTTASRSTYAEAVGISDAVFIAGGWGSSAAIGSDGLLFVCGSNSSGILGANQPTSTTASTFIQAVGISNAVAIACGYSHSIALRTDGKVFGADNNASGQLGDGTGVGRSAFVELIAPK